MASTCEHPIQAGGMCAICGQVLSEAQTSGAISMMHDTESVTVSRQEAQRLDGESTKHLLDQRKLALIVDLDQTIIHATVDPTVGEWLRTPDNPNFEALKGVGSFRLGMDGKAILDAGQSLNQAGPSSATVDDGEGCWYYVKPRPGLDNFLRRLSEKYELHVYTMGTRSYADCVCKLVDPDGSLFGTRILSRDENGSLVQKSLSRLFPMDTSMVVIIDDRGDVWQWSPNLIKVIPYDFFVGSGDINAGFLPAQTGPGTSSTTDPSSASSSSSSPSPASDADSTASSSPDTSASSDNGSPLPPPPPPPAAPKDTRSPTDKLNDAAEKAEALAAEREVKVKAEQSQKSIVSEQLDARPLARMQEQLDEKFGITSSNRSTPASEGAPSTAESQAAPAPPPKEETPSAAALPSQQTTQQNQYETATPSTDTNATSSSSSSNSLSPPQQPQPAHALLRDTDRELDRVKDILDEIHTTWFARWDDYVKASPKSKAAAASSSSQASASTLVKPTVMDIISEMKKRVLSDCDIVFSSLIPLSGRLDDSEYFWMAIEYGATCAPELKPETTHLVAAKVGTAKVVAAQRQQGTSVVWPGWLHDSIAHWKKMPEDPYLLPPSGGNGEEILSSAHPTEDELSSDDLDFALEDGDDDTTAASQEGAEGENKASGSGSGSRGGESSSAAAASSSSSSSDDPWSGTTELDAAGWAEADKELQEFLDGSEGDDEGGDEDGGSVFFGDDDDEEGRRSGTNTPSSSLRQKRLAGKRSRRSTPSVNGDGPADSNDSIRLVEDPPSSSSSGGGSASKRRRVVATATKQPDGTYRATGDVSTQDVGADDSSASLATPSKKKRARDDEQDRPARSHTNSFGSSASDGVDGDETQAFMKDLEDELEAALEGGDD